MWYSYLNAFPPPIPHLFAQPSCVRPDWIAKRRSVGISTQLDPRACQEKCSQELPSNDIEKSLRSASRKPLTPSLDPAASCSKAATLDPMICFEINLWVNTKTICFHLQHASLSTPYRSPFSPEALVTFVTSALGSFITQTPSLVQLSTDHLQLCCPCPHPHIGPLQPSCLSSPTHLIGSSLSSTSILKYFIMISSWSQLFEI